MLLDLLAPISLFIYLSLGFICVPSRLTVYFTANPTLADIIFCVMQGGAWSAGLDSGSYLLGYLATAHKRGLSTGGTRVALIGWFWQTQDCLVHKRIVRWIGMEKVK
jgi:hypothetical protein